MKAIAAVTLSLAFLLASCANPTEQSFVTFTPLLITSTSSPAVTHVPAETPLPPPAKPTVAPVVGIASTQINVRAEPSTGSNILGVIPANTNVEILGQDPGRNWYQIVYAQGIDGKGWVSAQYLKTAGGAQIPVVGYDGTDPNNQNVAIIQQQINVRSGPGTEFNSLGTLNAQDVVSLTGKDADGTWLQIFFTAGPDGKGWVNAAFVQVEGVENLPIVAQAGEIVGTGTPTGIAPTPTSTLLPAWDDKDSQNNPIVNVVFEPLGIQSFTYTGDLSTPQGDSQDWIQFVPYGNHVLATLECTGDTGVQVNLLENGQLTPLELACGNTEMKINVKAGTVHLIHLQTTVTVGKLIYVQYTMTLRAIP